MDVTYLYDIEGWALHDVGRWLQDALAPDGINIRCMAADAWHAQPVATDVLCFGYSGIVLANFDYRRWARRIVMTVHDPCEISHFEDRHSWMRWPMRPLPLNVVDAVSVISDELVEAFRLHYNLEVLRTPTWPCRAESIRRVGRARKPVDALHVFSSTNADSHFSRWALQRRWRHPVRFSRDQWGNISWRHLAALGVRTRRKNIPLLNRVADVVRSIPGASVDLTVGETAVRPRDAYEAALGRCTLYVCTSTMEGGPLPVMEAVLAGAAVLTTSVGQTAEWVTHGHNGFVCNTFRDFRGALRRYATEPGLLVAHQRAAMNIASERRQPPIDTWRRLLSGA